MLITDVNVLPDGMRIARAFRSFESDGQLCHRDRLVVWVMDDSKEVIEFKLVKSSTTDLVMSSFNNHIVRLIVSNLKAGNIEMWSAKDAGDKQTIIYKNG